MDKIKINSLRFAIQCNFPAFCGEDRTKEAVSILDDLLGENEKLKQQNQRMVEVLEELKNEYDYNKHCKLIKEVKEKL